MELHSAAVHKSLSVFQGFCNPAIKGKLIQSYLFLYVNTQEAQLSSVTRGENSDQTKKLVGRALCEEEERLSGVPCLSISSITALILCSVTFTRGLVGGLGDLLGCCTGKSIPGGSGRTRTPVPKSQPGSCLCTLTTAMKGILTSCLPRGSWKGQGGVVGETRSVVFTFILRRRRKSAST